MGHSFLNCEARRTASFARDTVGILQKGRPSACKTLQALNPVVSQCPSDPWSSPKFSLKHMHVKSLSTLQPFILQPVMSHLGLLRRRSWREAMLLEQARQEQVLLAHSFVCRSCASEYSIAIPPWHITITLTTLDQSWGRSFTRQNGLREITMR